MAEAKKPKKKTRRSAWSALWRVVKWAAIAIILVAVTPFILTVIYRFDGIKPISTLMISQSLAGVPVSRQWVDLEDIAPQLKHSVIMSEDGQFCRHHGIDLGELKAVIDDALAGEATRGASTITMQTAKNLFLWNGRSFIRKGLEIPLAVWIDFVIPKDRILEIYLNIAEWGPGIFGIDQAAGFHFGVNADALTQRQAALLAVTLPNPAVRDPSRPSNNLNRVARIIETRARQAGDYVGCVNPSSSG
ncbi:MAG: monofunctional biosynthetic peptidoglycan transglycosylase [Ahrensia sp.]